MVMPMALRVPRAAPIHHSPSTAQLASLSRRGRKAQPLVDDLAQRQIDPAQIRGEQHDAALGVERTRRSHADADDLSASDSPAGSARWFAGPG